ncbi:MAG: ABC transporter permease [Fibrobacteria bacterium]
MSRIRLRTIALKEMRHIFRDWQTLVVVLVMPVMMMFLYGYALNADAKEIPVLVEMPSPAPETRAVADKIDASQLFSVKGVVASAADPAELFRLHNIKVLFRFPPGFARDLRRPGGAKIQVLIDGSDPNLGTIIRNASEPLLLGATVEVLGVKQPKVLDLRTLVLYNPEQSSALFFVPGLMAIILLMISALLTSVAIAREKELGTMGQLLVSPLHPLEIIVGKIIPYLFLAAVDGLLVMAVGRLAFGVRIAGSAWLLGACSLAYIFTALSIGLLISTLVKRQQHAMFAALGATMMPTVLLSGFIFPVASMPLQLQVISHIIPATYFLEIVRGIILKGVGLRELWKPLLILSCEGLALMAIAINKFKVKL